MSQQCCLYWQHTLEANVPAIPVLGRDNLCRNEAASQETVLVLVRDIFWPVRDRNQG